MSKRSVRHVICALFGLIALAALFVPSSASAARIEGFQSRAGSFSDQSCVTNSYSGVINTCSHSILVQAVATITTPGNYYANAVAYADDDSTLQPWGVRNNLDMAWTGGSQGHGTDTYGNELWANYYPGSTTYVPASGALIFMVWLPPNQKIASYTYGD
ncbi:MAG: hypothetical protein WDO69_08460 [Pseudomonadota bacterium]